MAAMSSLSSVLNFLETIKRYDFVVKMEKKFFKRGKFLHVAILFAEL